MAGFQGVLCRLKLDHSVTVRVNDYLKDAETSHTAELNCKMGDNSLLSHTQLFLSFVNIKILIRAALRKHFNFFLSVNISFLK